MFTWGAGEGLFLVFQPIYLERLGASPVVIGTILGAVGIAMTIAHIPAGHLSDRLGSRPVLWAAWFIGTLSAWIMALAHRLPLFVVGLLLYSLTSFVMPPLSSYVTAARGEWSVGRAITFIGAAFNLGAIVGPITGGIIGDQVGLRQVYLVSAIVFVLSSSIVLFIRHQPIENPSPEGQQDGININRRYLGFLGMIFLATFSTYLPQPLSPNYLQNYHGLTLGQIGRLGSIGSAGIVILNLVLGQLDARSGFLLAQGAGGAFSLLLWRGTGMPWFALGYFLAAGYRTARVLATAQTRTLVNPSRMGLAYGITEAVNSSAVILAAPIAGYLYQQGPSSMYIAGLVLTVVSILVSARFSLHTPGVEAPAANVIKTLKET
jgi:MFS family permease